MSDGPGLWTAALAASALLGFAANSLLCRAALGARNIDPASFTAIRIASGAATLAVLVAGRRARGSLVAAGTWSGAWALFAYAIAFSLAYVRLVAGAGALLLFGAVQATMIGRGLAAGERPGALEWAGMLLAVAGLVGLVRPGTTAPDAAGAALMAAAGVAWGIYSLRGRGASDPLAVTAGNFLRAAPMAAAALAVAVVIGGTRLSLRGVALAIASGAIASGVGYSLWYAALRGLSATRAAVVQLLVPVMAAAGGVLLLGEPPTARLLGSGAAILGGVALAVARRRPPGR